MKSVARIPCSVADTIAMQSGINTTTNDMFDIVSNKKNQIKRVHLTSNGLKITHDGNYHSFMEFPEYYKHTVEYRKHLHTYSIDC